MYKDEDQMNTEWAEAAWTDFLGFLQEGKWKNARAVMDSTKENGFISDSVSMSKQFNAAYANADLIFEDYEHEIPVMTAFEAHKWASPQEVGPKGQGKWKREGDENYPA